MSGPRLLIISPIRNEAAHIERVIDAVAAQELRPARWVIVDDGSSDGTPQIVERAIRGLGFVTFMRTPDDFTAPAKDRHAVAAAPRAFNHALGTVDAERFTHLGKLDGDIELPPDYFARLLPRFELDPQLGIAGGTLIEPRGGRWVSSPSAPDHVRGALKVWTRSCFDAIGGVTERLGWDGVDETLARMRGYRTQSFPDIVALHHRPTGVADGRMRGHVRWGTAHYVLQYHPAWVVARTAKVASSPPVGVSALAYLYGYGLAAARRVPRVGDVEYRRFVHAEQRSRARAAIQRRLQVPERLRRSSVGSPSST